MNAKEYLMQYRESMERTSEIETHLHELKAEAIRLKDHEGHSVKLDAAVAQYVDACNAESAELNRLAALRGEIQGMIDSVSDKTLRSLLYWRYICGCTWEQAAVNMHYSWRRVLQLHGVALRIVSVLLQERFH